MMSSSGRWFPRTVRICWWSPLLNHVGFHAMVVQPRMISERLTEKTLKDGHIHCHVRGHLESTFGVVYGLETESTVGI